MSLYESFDFSKGVIEVTKIDFSLEGLHWRIFLTVFGGTFFAGFYPGVFFLRPKTKCTGKKPRKNSVTENSSKVRRNTSPQERWKNYAKTWVVGQSDNGQLRCGTSLVQYFGSLNVGCRTCDTGQCKWLYKRLQMYRNLQKQSSLRLRIRMIKVLYKS